MVAKFCPAPRGGGSARGNVRYVLGYELGPKKAATRVAFASLVDEAMRREDRGIGTIWEPVAGAGIRPAAIFARGVTSLATADIEMQAISAANTRLRSSPTMHAVVSFNLHESQTITNTMAIEAALRAIDKLGLEEHQLVLAVHRDTDNVHVHCAIARCNPFTLRAWDNYRHHYRLPWKLREAELELGLEHDNGAAVYDSDERCIRWATRAEKKAWKIESFEHRLENQARRYLSDYGSFESPMTWARDVLGADVQRYMLQAQERGESLRSADVHAVVADKGARIEALDQDRLLIRIMQRRSAEDIESARSRIIEADGVLQKRDVFGEASDLYVPGQYETASVDISIREFLGYTHQESESPAIREQTAFLRLLCDVEASEERFVEQVRRDPSLVGRALIADGLGVFTRDDIVGFLARRVSDSNVVIALSGFIEQADKQLRMISADTEHPLFSTESQIELEQRVRARVLDLAQRRDGSFDTSALERAIEKLESRKSLKLTQEQRRLLRGVQRRLSWANGDAGSGKTTAMLGLQLYAAETGRHVIGLSLAEKAARELGAAANVKTCNIAKALTLEEHGKEVFKRGAIVILDETSMTAYKQLDKILHIARERDCIVFGIGDKAQIPAIEAGCAHNVVIDATRTVGAFTELTIVRRQRGELAFMSYDPETKSKGLTHEFGRAIREGDQEAVANGVKRLAQHRVLQGCRDRETAISAAAAYYVDAVRAGQSALLLSADRLTCRHLNDRVRDLLGTTGSGRSFRTASHGVREVTVGDRIAFLRNNSRLSGLGVDNGDLGTVRAVNQDDDTGRWCITVDVDKKYTINFDPASYRDWTHGFSLTSTKGQGSTVDRVASVIDKSAYAELFHSMMTRAQFGLRCFYSEANFPTISDLAEHLGSRIRGKDDVLLLKEIENRTGGADSPCAIRVRAAMAKDADALRVRHRSFLRNEQNLFEVEAEQLYTRISRDLSSGACNESLKLRSAIAKLRRKHRPLSFVEWAARNWSAIGREAAFSGADRNLKQERRQRPRIQETSRVAQRKLKF